MPIDPERLEGRRNSDDPKIAAQLSPEAHTIVKFLAFYEKGGEFSIDGWLLKLLGEKIEAEAPNLREILSDPEGSFTETDAYQDGLKALYIVCPPDEPEEPMGQPVAPRPRHF